MTENLAQKTFFFLILIAGAILLAIPPDDRPDVVKEELERFKIRYGLDLQGGAEIRLQIPKSEVFRIRNEEAQTGKASYTLQAAVSDSLEVIEKRIDESGIVRDAMIRRQGEDIILIQLPGVTPRELGEIKRLITQLGTLELRIVATEEADAANFIQTVQDPKRPDFGQPINGPDGKPARLNRNIAQLRQERQTAREGNRPMPPAPKAIIDGKIINYSWVPVDDRAQGDFGNATEVLLKRSQPEWDGSKLSKAVKDLNPQTLQPVIHFEIRGATNRKRFGNFTASHIKRRMAIVYNGRVVSAPTIQSRIPGDGIITGLTDTEVNDLTKQLKSGSLRVQPKLVSSNEVGPSLGQYTIRNGQLATQVGFGLVIVFMVVYYLVAGLVASAALVVNLLLLYGSMVLFGATLTLPGIAGIILTVGMAVDANIIIFERIREERAAGGALLQSIEAGYERALTAIVDANITTLITAAILYYFGSGAVKGFAVTLLLGILTSLFTALYVTKHLFGLLLSNGFLKNDLKMIDAIGTPSWPLVSWRPVAMTGSVIVVAAGMALFSRTDDIYGIDLAGGTLTEMALQEDVSAGEVRAKIPALFSAEVQENLLYETGAEGERLTKKKYSIQARNLDLVELIKDREKILADLTQYLTEERGKAWVDQHVDQARTGARTQEELGSEYGQLLRFLVTLDEGIKRGIVDEAKTLAGEVPDGTDRELVTKNPENASDADKPLAKFLWEVRKDQVSPEYFRFELALLFKGKLVPDGIGLPVKTSTGWYVDIAFDTPKTADEVQTRVGQVRVTPDEGEEPSADLPIEFPGARVQALGADGKPVDDGAASSHRFRLTVGEPGAVLFEIPARVAKLQNDQFLLSEPFPTSQSIGGVVAKYQKNDAIKAVLFSLLAILAYITLRFQFIYGVAAIVCLTHDVLFTLGAIALFGGHHFGPDSLVAVEINLPILAAFLTIIGYSLNDTIVVFDRIRENANKPGRHDFEEVANASINQTLSRTLITSVTTMIAVVTLFVLNFKKGGVIEGFSFALIVGVVIGTYSSIFIATPILVEYHRREQRRLEDEAAQKAAEKAAGKKKS